MRVQKAWPPETGSSRHHIHIDGLSHPGHRADGAVVVARVERDLAAAPRLPRRPRRRRRQPSNRQRADQRAAHRAGRVLPRQRRAGVQEHPLAHVEDLAGRADVDEQRPGGEEPLDGDPVGRARRRSRASRRALGGSPKLGGRQSTSCTSARPGRAARRRRRRRRRRRPRRGLEQSGKARRGASLEEAPRRLDGRTRGAWRPRWTR